MNEFDNVVTYNVDWHYLVLFNQNSLDGDFIKTEDYLKLLQAYKELKHRMEELEK